MADHPSDQSSSSPLAVLKFEISSNYKFGRDRARRPTRTPRTAPTATPKGTQAQITPRASQNYRRLREIARYRKTGGCTRFSVIWGGGFHGCGVCYCINYGLQYPIKTLIAVHLKPYATVTTERPYSVLNASRSPAPLRTHMQYGVGDLSACDRTPCDMHTWVAAAFDR